MAKVTGGESRWSYREEFPDFDPSWLPAIPEEWVDISWHNDACPSFKTTCDRIVFIDYPNKKDREIPTTTRFTVTAATEDDESMVLFMSDDWAKVIEFIEVEDPKQRRWAEAAYEKWRTGRNYLRPAVDPHWANSRETHIAVATAIHAIAFPKRPAETIWAAPTAAEVLQVTAAVKEYIAKGDFPTEPDGRYQWGDEVIVIGESK